MVWSTQGFVRLDDLLLPGPLPALVAAGLVLGVAAAGRMLARRLLRPGEPTGPESAAAFLLVAGALGAALHGLAVAGALRLAPLRLAGWAIAIAGYADLATSLPLVRGALGAARVAATGRLDRALLGLSLAAMAALTYLALGPAADADSLAYHLGLPLEWLRRGGMEARPDWHHAPLAGLGEALGALGLAAGTDRLGAAFQLSGVVVAALVLWSLAPSPARRVLALALATLCPLLVSLAGTQKFQLLPAAAVLAALAPALAGRPLDGRRALLAFGALALAAGSKYSFLLSGGVATLVLLALARRQGRLRPALGAAVAAYAFVSLPVFVRNWWFYGDPLAPMLERFLPHADALTVACAKYLENAGIPRDGPGLARLLTGLLAPLGPADAANFLGVGWLGLAALRGRGPARRLALAASLGALPTLVFSQWMPRHFLEFYLLAAAALVVGAGPRAERLARWALALQGTAALAAAGLGAYLLGAAPFSDGARTRYLERHAYDRADAGWIDAAVPPGARILTQSRSNALLPRDFTVYRGCPEMLPPESSLPRCALLRALQGRPAQVIVRRVPPDAAFASVDAFAQPIAESGPLREAVRNPFVARGEYRLQALSIDAERLDAAWSRFAREHPECAAEP